MNLEQQQPEWLGPQGAATVCLRLGKDQSGPDSIGRLILCRPRGWATNLIRRRARPAAGCGMMLGAGMRERSGSGSLVENAGAATAGWRERTIKEEGAEAVEAHWIPNPRRRSQALMREELHRHHG
jgi:hypothetical protein